MYASMLTHISVNIVNFLGQEKSKNVATLSTIVSAISSEIPVPMKVSYPASSIIGHPHVKRLLTAIAKSNSVEKAKRADEPFDIRILWNYVLSLGPPESLTLTELTHCCVVLVRIHTRHRSSDLARYALKSLEESDQQITGWISNPKDRRAMSQHKWSRKFVITKTETMGAFQYDSFYLSKIRTVCGVKVVTPRSWLVQLRPLPKSEHFMVEKIDENI